MSTRSATTMALPESPLRTPRSFPVIPTPFPMLMTLDSPSLRDDRRGIGVEIDHDVARARAGRGAGDDVRNGILIQVILRALQLADRERVHGTARVRVGPALRRRNDVSGSRRGVAEEGLHGGRR